MVRPAFRQRQQAGAEGGDRGAGAEALIALWRYVERGELPEGAVEKNWRLNVDSTARRHAKQEAALAAADLAV